MSERYEEEIAERNPLLFLLLVDQSSSMKQSFGTDQNKSKADETAEIVNQTLRAIVKRNVKGSRIKNRFHVAAIGYGDGVGNAFGGKLSQKEYVDLDELSKNPVSLKKVEKTASDGKVKVRKYPVWIEPKAYGSTPMCEALTLAADVVGRWIGSHKTSHPPIVLNISDGAATDGNPCLVAEKITSLTNSNGSNSLIFNCHIKHLNLDALEYPSSEKRISDKYARLLFEMSSPLTPRMLSAAKDLGFDVEEAARGFVFNADAKSLVRFLNIGTVGAGAEIFPE
jgi:hypothetical protein